MPRSCPVRPRLLALVLVMLPLTACAADSEGSAKPTLVTVVDAGLEFPTAIASPRDRSGRLFVLERAGRIRVIDAQGELVGTPWYTRAVNTGDMEQGLLGIAFDPGFADNGTVYIAYSATPAEQWGMILRRLVADDPGAAVFAGSDEVVMRVGGLVANHNAGDLHFGPDGHLYWSIGAGTGDPRDHPHAEALDDLRGKILRLDVRNPARKGPGNRCGSGGGRRAYAIPDDNPHAGERGLCGEIWLHGLRNAWRFSIDQETGDLWLGDVGKDREEISVYPTGGDNRHFGYPRCQASHDYPSTGASDCPTRTGTVAPVFEYAGGDQGRCAVIGGVRYRGPNAALRGSYVFGDACSSEILIGRQDATGEWRYRSWNAGIATGYGTVAAFGEGPQGELYLVDHLAGHVHRID